MNSSSNAHDISSARASDNGNSNPAVQKKLQKLEQVFAKCLENSMSAVTDQDFQECFGEQKKAFGMQSQRIYINLLAEVEKRMETEEFPRINQEYHIPEIMEAITAPTDASLSASSHPTVEDPKKLFRPMIKALKRAEIEELTNGIKFLESEIKKSRDIAGRLRTQMINEIEALNEENMKILHASNQAI